MKSNTPPYPKKSIGDVILDAPPTKECIRLRDQVGAKWCCSCRLVKPHGDFKLFGSGKHSKMCVPCRTRELAARQVRWKEWRRRLRVEILTRYGGVCACCGEGSYEFLAIDHIGGGGNAHRRALGFPSGLGFYLWLKKSGFPAGFRVLCHNCNQAMGYYGYCPHGKATVSC